MGQGLSSSSASGRGSSTRVPQPFPVDPATGLPLIDCPRCGDVRLVARTVAKRTKNRGRRFFVCPRNQKGVPGSCRTYFFQPQYVKYLQRHGLLDAVPDLPRATSFPLKLENLFGDCETWDTSIVLDLNRKEELGTGVEMPRLGARLHARISFLSEDWLKPSLKEHIMGVSVGLLSTMNHNLAYNLTWRNLTYPARMSSNSIQEHLGHSFLSSIKYAYKVDQRVSSIRPTCGYTFLSSTQVGCLATGSKDSLCLGQDVDLRVAFPLGVLNGALNAGMAAGVILPLARRSTRSSLPLSGFKAKGRKPKDLGTYNSENGASTSPEIHGGGDIAVTAFADLSFDLPLKPLRELGIHGHAFVSARNLVKLTEHGRGKFALTDFLQKFRCSAGFGVVVPTKLFRIEMNYCYILKQFDHDRGKAGLQFSFSCP